MFFKDSLTNNMNISKNENALDRLIRVLLAEIFFIFAYFWLSSFFAYFLYTLSAVMIITALTGFCGLYKVLGIDTTKYKLILSFKILMSIFVILFLIIGVVGIYSSIFFTKKFFLEDYNKMNNYYKQTLYYTGQEKRIEAVDSYTMLVSEYVVFNNKYQKYHPYSVARDRNLNSDLSSAANVIFGLKEKLNTGDLKLVHKELEQVRPIFQDILKRNGFSILAVYLVDFHDAMEKIIATADDKNATGLAAVYPEVDEKLKEVENIVNDSEIQAIRKNLNDVYDLAKENKIGELSAKAAELKSSFVKVYLKRG